MTINQLVLIAFYCRHLNMLFFFFLKNRPLKKMPLNKLTVKERPAAKTFNSLTQLSVGNVFFSEMFCVNWIVFMLLRPL